MGEIVQLDSRRKPNPDAILIFNLAADFDAVIKDALSRDVPVKVVAGTLAHRLANLIDHVDHKTPLWKMCERVIMKFLTGKK